MTEELAPCPHCAGSARMRGTISGTYFVQCDLCDAKGTPCSTEQLAASEWNRRTPALAAAPVQQPNTDGECQYCRGAEFPGWKRGMRCPACNGQPNTDKADLTARSDEAATAPLAETPALTKVLDALRMGRVACEWSGKQEEADKFPEAFEAARSLSAALPEGWQAVPKVPTREMLGRALYANERGDIQVREVRSIYYAMLDAAPSPPGAAPAPQPRVKLSEVRGLLRPDQVFGPDADEAPATEVKNPNSFHQGQPSGEPATGREVQS